MSEWEDYFTDENDIERWKANFEDPDDASYWADLSNIEPHEAAIYHQNGFTPHDVRDWQNSGVTDYKDVLNWKQNGITDARTAAAFAERGLNATHYKQWSTLGIEDPDEIVTYQEKNGLKYEDIEKYLQPLVKEKKFQLDTINTWLSNNIPVSEIPAWINKGFKSPSFVSAWKQMGMTPKEAKEWYDVIERPELVASWIRAGWGLTDVKNMINAGYTTPEEIDYAIENNLTMKVGSDV
jgi:hypothetical protein